MLTCGQNSSDFDNSKSSHRARSNQPSRAEAQKESKERRRAEEQARENVVNKLNSQLHWL
jgi:hypothetical protein